MRLHRLIAILLLIESRGHMKAKELARALETSVRTIYRDIDTLCESGVPLTATTGPNGGIYLMEGYHIDINHLHADDVINLYLSGIGIRPEGHSEAGLQLQNTLLKLEKNLPSEYKSDIKKAKERFYYDEIPWWGERAVIPFFEVIRKSVWQSKKLAIQYGFPGKEKMIRIIHPYGMIVKNMEWYVAAFCEKSKEIRTFKCERIHQAELLEGTFIIPADFSLEQDWKKREEDFKKARKDTEDYTVTIKLHKYDKGILDRLEVYSIRFEGDDIFVDINMHKFEFACHEVMDIVGRAEVLAPPKLRNYVFEKLKTIIKIYDE